MTVSASPVLTRFERDRYEPRGVNGEPVWRRAEQIRDVLSHRLGPRHARFFATPALLKGDAIGWTAAWEGTVTPWAAARPEQRAAASGEVAALLRDIDGLAQDLQARGAESGRILTEILTTALYVASTRTLFFVDDELVAAHWGMTDRADPEAPSVLPRLGDFVDVALESEPNAETEPVAERRSWLVYWIWGGALALLVTVAVTAFLLRDRLPGGMPAKALEIPEESVENGDLGFLEGDWEIVSEILDSQTHEPVHARYRFDAGGQGEVRARLLERDVLCTGAIRAEFSGRTLKFTHLDKMKCEDESIYNVLEIVCETEGSGRATCALEQQGRSTLDVVVQRASTWSE